MKDDNRTFDKGSLSDSFVASGRPVLTVDVEKYAAMLDAPGLSDERKKEVLQALWTIMMNFIELGFEVHPLQDACGQNSGTGSPDPKEAFDRVRLKEPDNKKPSMDSAIGGSLEVT